MAQAPAYRIYESLPEARFQMGGGNAQGGYEHATSRWAISIRARVTSENGDKPEGERLEDIQIWVTVPQIAQIVIQFFWCIVGSGGAMTALLKRLLRARWNVMTSPLAKGTIPGGEGYDMTRYWDVRGKSF